MMKNDSILTKLTESPTIRRLGLRKESVANIINSYDEIILNTLLENGCIEIGNGIVIEVVQLLDRVHVLRGVSYKSNRKYKLKLTMEQSIYEKIESYYDKLQEDIK